MADRVTGFAYAALACFGVEYITLFLGVSLFIRPMMTLNIVAHFVGLILVILLYYDVSQSPPAGMLFSSFDVNCLNTSANWVTYTLNSYPLRFVVEEPVYILTYVPLPHQNWSLAAWQAFVVVFNFVPMVLELLVLGFMSRFSYARY